MPLCVFTWTDKWTSTCMQTLVWKSQSLHPHMLLCNSLSEGLHTCYTHVRCLVGQFGGHCPFPRSELWDPLQLCESSSAAANQSVHPKPRIETAAIHRLRFLGSDRTSPLLGRHGWKISEKSAPANSLRKTNQLMNHPPLTKQQRGARRLKKGSKRTQLWLRAAWL